MNNRLSAICLAAFLALASVITGCDAFMDEILSSETPSRTRTPTRTSVPTRTRTPSLTFTPSPIGAMPRPTYTPRIGPTPIEAWSSLCAQAAGQGAVSGAAQRYPANSAAVYVQDESGLRGWTPRETPLEMISSADPAAAQFLICVREGSEFAFKYSGDKVEGRRRLWEITLVDTRSQSVFYKNPKLVGANPPSFAMVSKGTTVVHGPDPIDPLIDALIAGFINMPPLTALEESEVEGMVFSPDGKMLLVDLSTYWATRLVEHALTGFGQGLALTSKTIIRGYSSNPTTSLHYTPDGNGLVYSRFSPNETSNLIYLQIQRASSGERLTVTGKAACMNLNCLAGPVLAGNVIRRGDCEWKLGAAPACTPRLSAAGQLLASSENGSWLAIGPVLLPTATYPPLATRTPTPKPGEIAPTALFTPTRPTATPAPLVPPKAVKLWNGGGVTGEIVTARTDKYTPPYDPPKAIFSPDGSKVALMYYSFNWELWDTATREQTGTLPGYAWLAFSPDGTRLVGGLHGDPGADVYDLGAHQYVGTLAPGIGALKSAVFHPDGKRLALASERFVRVMELP